MNDDVVTLLIDTLVTSGVAAVIVFGLSGFIGKIWANRLMEKERHKQSIEFEKLKRELQNESDERLASIANQFEIFKNTHLREHSDKLIIYRTAMELIATMLAKLELIVMKSS